jgi:hypothetical protein
MNKLAPAAMAIAALGTVATLPGYARTAEGSLRSNCKKPGIILPAACSPAPGRAGLPPLAAFRS